MKKNLNILMIIPFLIYTSCIKKEKRTGNNEQEYFDTSVIPDTVIVGKVYKREIKYTSPLDTVKTSKKVTRDIFFFLTTQNGIFDNVDAIQNTKHDVFIKNEDDEFLSFRFSFDKTGLNNFKGIIQDMVIMEEYYDDGKGRIITRLTEIEKEIFVIEQ